MQARTVVLSSLALCLATSVPLQAANHRLAILDIGRWPNGREGSDHHQLLVVEIESGKILAHIEVGFNTDLALSSDGDEVSVISCFRGPRLLEFYRTSDLKRLKSATLPDSVRLYGYQLGASQDSRFTPTGKELLLEGPADWGGPAHLASTLLTCLKREVDAFGVYKLSEQAVLLPRCSRITYLRVADWPKVHVWNANLGLLEVVDFSTGKTVSRLYLGNDPAVAHMDPADLETADTQLIFRIRNRGVVVSDGGRYAYYIQRHPANSREAIDVLKRIDLRANPPKIITQGKEPQPNLFPHPAVVSDAARSLFVVKAKVGPPGLNGSTVQPTRRVLVIDTKTLKTQKEIEFPIDFENLEVSKDGKYLYGLSPESGKLAVMAVSSGKEVQVLDKLGTYPHLMLALPEKQEK